MPRQHGAETFFIEGEGIVGQQAGGRDGGHTDPVTACRGPRCAGPHATGGPRGAALPALAPQTGEHTARAGPDQESWRSTMVGGGGGSGTVPAGYTYLGQFVDHDLTMDRHRRPARRRHHPGRAACRAARPGWTWTPSTAPGPANPGSAKFYKADGLHLKIGNTIRIGSDAEKTGHDLPRVHGGADAGADPRPSQRREPDRGPDARGDDPLPQRGRRRAARLGARCPAVPGGPQAGDAALPVAAPARLPAAHRRPGGRRRRVHERSRPGRARRRPRPMSRRCRSSSRSRPSGSGTAWCAAPTTGTGASPARPADWSTCSTSRVSAAASAASCSC